MNKAPVILSCPECDIDLRRRPGNVYSCSSCRIVTYWAASEEEAQAIKERLSGVEWAEDGPKGFDIVQT